MTEPSFYHLNLPNDRKAYFFRLQNHELKFFSQYSLAINTLHFPENKRIEKLSWGQVYLGLVTLFGEPTSCIDNYKVSFSFPLLIQISEKNGDIYQNLLVRLRDFKGSLEAEYWQVLNEEDYLHHTKQGELCWSRNDTWSDKDEENVQRIEHSILNKVSDAAERLTSTYTEYSKLNEEEKKSHSTPAPIPFIKDVEACHLIYGWGGGSFFQFFESGTDEFNEKIRILKAQFEFEKLARQRGEQLIRQRIHGSNIEPAKK